MTRFGPFCLDRVQCAPCDVGIDFGLETDLRLLFHLGQRRHEELLVLLPSAILRVAQSAIFLLPPGFPQANKNRFDLRRLSFEAPCITGQTAEV